MLPSPQPNSLANSDSDQLMNMYRQSTVPLQKDTIMKTMKEKGYLPNEEDMGKILDQLGLYPDTDDPNDCSKRLNSPIRRVHSSLVKVLVMEARMLISK